MGKRLFKRLAASMRELGEITHRERAPSRRLEITATDVQKIRKSAGLSQANFERIFLVQLGTLPRAAGHLEEL